MPDNADSQEPQGVEPQDAPQSTGSFACPAQILRGTRAGGAASAAELLEIARERAPDPDVIDEATIFFFRAVISTSALDSYFTRMHRTTLENFANEASEGRSFLEGHNTRSRAVGQSLRGRYVGASSSSKARTEADFFITPEPSGVGRKAEIIHEIRTGTARDVSVGFSLGEDGLYRCDLCKRDYMGGECPHWLGTDWEGWGNDRAEAICTCTIENGHLNETSTVYDGATPGAAITKALRALEEGQMTPERARVLEPMYRVKLAAPRNWALSHYASTRTDTPAGSITATDVQAAVDTLNTEIGAGTHQPVINLNISTPDADSLRRSSGQIAAEIGRQLSADNGRKERVMPDEPNTANTDGQNTVPPPAADPPETRTDAAPPVTTTEAFTAPRTEPPPEERTAPADWTAEVYEQRVNAVLAGTEIPGAEMAECVRRLCAEVSELRELRPLAVDGRLYREALVGDVLHQAARSQGKAYDEALERELCVGRTTAQLVQMHNRYKSIADALFTSGRVTVDTDEPAPAPVAPPRVPDAAYRG